VATPVDVALIEDVTMAQSARTMSTQSVPECVFCRIVAGAEASVVHEDDDVLAFLTIGPVNPGHVLVIPKQHYPDLADLPEPLAARCFTVAQRVAAAIRASGLHCEGVNVFLADGEAAFQEVFHLHLHVFPRFKGDAFRITADWSVKPPRGELDAIARQIRAAVDGNTDASSGPH
jgi:histidine triad (HIT) family protein